MNPARPARSRARHNAHRKAHRNAYRALAAWPLAVALGCLPAVAPSAAAATIDLAQLAIQPQTPQRLPRQSATTSAALEGVVLDAAGHGIVGPRITLTNSETGGALEATGTSEGIFRIVDLAPGLYALRVEAGGYAPFERAGLRLRAGEALTVELSLHPLAENPAAAVSRLPRASEMGPPQPAPPAAPIPAYRELRRAPLTEPLQAQPEALPPASQVFLEMPDRWDIDMPDWSRYPRRGEYPYVTSHWYDPFNRNRLKGDEPIWPHVLGRQTFLDLTATSDTDLDGRRLPTPTGVSEARPGTPDFFGNGDQFALQQTFRFTFDLFHGDTSFAPPAWRIQVTPAVNVNYLAVRELGLVNVDVRAGLTRLDAQASLQEAFVEAKLADLSPNYDFISVRAGIQRFNSDFRGFLFSDEQPGVRVFGTLRSSRWQYNAAYFQLLEKNTNSGLNSFAWRHQQVALANFYRQDFLRSGYTAEFSIHYSQDDATTHYDENGFLARPSPVGTVLPHAVRAVYLGWNGDGHFGPWNLSHAFYQALGNDDLNPIAGRPIRIDAQMAAAEISRDRDWMRFKGSVFFASGDANPRGAVGRGFDSIADDPNFAGGFFSLWDHEAVRLTGTGVNLTNEDSLLPDLRPDKEEGQANFVNPGLFLLNAGAEFNLTTKLKALANFNYLWFVDTEPLELLLFQSPIRRAIGADYSVGVEYHPPLTENIVLRAGAGGLTPGQGLQDIYTARTFLFVFADLRFQF